MLGYFFHRLIWWIKHLSPQSAAAAETAYWGSHAEKKAAQLLKNKGFAIVARNWRPRHGHGEIDIVARDRSQQLIFVEVRCRKNDALLRGALSLNQNKKRVLRQTIQSYLRAYRYRFNTIPSWRFDLVEAQTAHHRIVSLCHFEGVSL